MQTVIKVTCVDQTLQLTATPVIACGGSEDVRVEFSFCPLWQGYPRTAMFWRTHKEVHTRQLDAADSCLIPAEVLQAQGVMHFGVFGVNPDGVRRTTEEVRYHIGPGAITAGTQPPDPTPELYTQLMAAAAIAQSVRADADAGKFKGEAYILTEADKTDIVGQVLAALPTAEGVSF